MCLCASLPFFPIIILLSLRHSLFHTSILLSSHSPAFQSQSCFSVTVLLSCHCSVFLPRRKVSGCFPCVVSSFPIVSPVFLSRRRVFCCFPCVVTYEFGISAVSCHDEGFCSFSFASCHPFPSQPRFPVTTQSFRLFSLRHDRHVGILISAQMCNGVFSISVPQLRLFAWG